MGSLFPFFPLSFSEKDESSPLPAWHYGSTHEKYPHALALNRVPLSSQYSHRVRFANPFIKGYWEMRYGQYFFPGWSAFRSGNTFYAHHLAAYPPDSPNSNELSAAFRVIAFALEQDPWTYASPPPPQSPTLLQQHHLRDTRRATDYALMLNVGATESHDCI